MFALPFLFGWVTPYVSDVIPNFEDNLLAYATGGDALLLASLFVLGGDFWDKIRALFVYSDKVCPRPRSQQSKNIAGAENAAPVYNPG